MGAYVGRSSIFTAHTQSSVFATRLILLGFVLAFCLSQSFRTPNLGVSNGAARVTRGPQRSAFMAVPRRMIGPFRTTRSASVKGESSAPQPQAKPAGKMTLEQLKERIKLQQEAKTMAQKKEQEEKAKKYSEEISRLRELQPVADTYDNGVKSGVSLVSDSDGEALKRILGETAAPCLIDHTDTGIIKVSGKDRLDFLHGLTTNDIATLTPGSHLATVFTTRTGRMMDLTTAIATEDSIYLLVSPGNVETMLEVLDKYILASKVKLQDASFDFVPLRVLNSQLNLDQSPRISRISPQDDTDRTVHTYLIDDGASKDGEMLIEIHNSVTDGIPGTTLLVPTSVISEVYQGLKEGVLLAEKGEDDVTELGKEGWEKIRIYQGIPKLGAEVTELYNPMEAQLWDTLNFLKGCYIGQETIARLKTFKGVKQLLHRFKLDKMPEEFGENRGGMTIMSASGKKKIGTLTSCATIGDEVWGLGYARMKAELEVGDEVSFQGSEVTATVCDLPRLPEGLPEWMMEEEGEEEEE